MQLQAREFKWGLSVNKWSDVKCSDVGWTDVIYVKWFCFQVKWSEASYGKVLGDKSTMYIRVTLYWGYWLYCDYFIWCVPCNVLVLYCFIMCGCFGNMCTCIYCVLQFFLPFFCIFCLCVFILICLVCTSVRTTATS